METTDSQAHSRPNGRGGDLEFGQMQFQYTTQGIVIKNKV